MICTGSNKSTTVIRLIIGVFALVALRLEQAAVFLAIVLDRFGRYLGHGIPSLSWACGQGTLSSHFFFCTRHPSLSPLALLCGATLGTGGGGTGTVGDAEMLILMETLGNGVEVTVRVVVDPGLVTGGLPGNEEGPELGVTGTELGDAVTVEDRPGLGASVGLEGIVPVPPDADGMGCTQHRSTLSLVLPG